MYKIFTSQRIEQIAEKKNRTTIWIVLVVKFDPDLHVVLISRRSGSFRSKQQFKMLESEVMRWNWSDDSLVWYVSLAQLNQLSSWFRSQENKQQLQRQKTKNADRFHWSKTNVHILRQSCLYMIHLYKDSKCFNIWKSTGVDSSWCELSQPSVFDISLARGSFTWNTTDRHPHVNWLEFCLTSSAWFSNNMAFTWQSIQLSAKFLCW